MSRKTCHSVSIYSLSTLFTCQISFSFSFLSFFVFFSIFFLCFIFFSSSSFFFLPVSFVTILKKKNLSGWRRTLPCLVPRADAGIRTLYELSCLFCLCLCLFVIVWCFRSSVYLFVSDFVCICLCICIWVLACLYLVFVCVFESVSKSLYLSELLNCMCLWVSL